MRQGNEAAAGLLGETRSLRSDSGQESGQAIVEYVITLMMALILLGILTSGFNASLRRTWKKIATQIAAGCPTCPKS